MPMATSTPFPLSSLKATDKDASPEEFLHFLRTLIKDHLSAAARIPASNSQSWVAVISGLSDHFLTPLPSSHEATWEAISEKVQLVEITLEVLQRAMERVEFLFGGPGDFARRMFGRLLDLNSSLFIWTDVKVFCELDHLMPLGLQSKVTRRMVGLLRNLGNSATPSNMPDEPAWRNMRGIVQECLECINGIAEVAAKFTFLTVS
jgi:serine/threonine-protein kinase ATR